MCSKHTYIKHLHEKFHSMFALFCGWGVTRTENEYFHPTGIHQQITKAPAKITIYDEMFTNFH